MNRRSIISAAWTVPVVVLAAAAPSFATSPVPAPPPVETHTCHVKKCRPVVKGRRIAHPSGARRWEHKIEKTCEWVRLLGDTRFVSISPIPALSVVWVPYPAPGRPHKARLDVVPIDYGQEG